MSADPILAIDVGKYKRVACVYDRATAAAEYRTITTSRAEVERLVRASRRSRHRTHGRMANRKYSASGAML